MDQQSKIIWNPYAPGYFENPYDHFRAYREQNPIHKVLDNSWIFFRYSEISEILSSNNFEVSELSEFFKAKEPYIFKNTDVCPYLSTGTKMWPMYLNHEVHKHARAVLGKSLNLKKLDHVMIEFAETINRQYQHKRSFDLVTYCSEYVFLVVKHLLGIDTQGEFEKIKNFSNALARSQDVFVPKQVYLEINAWLLWGREILADVELKKNLKIHSDQSGLDYSEQDMYSITALALMAAFETSKDNLSIALHTILQDPGLIMHVLECDPQELNVLIEELFRFSSPLQYTIRMNKKPLAYGHIQIPAHSRLFLCLASANRDEAVFENPNDILVKRTPNEHISFGKGLHFCLGANIARLELRHCLKPMVKFLQNYRLKKNTQAAWSKQIFMRTLESVELESKIQ